MQDTCLAPGTASPKVLLEQVGRLDGYLHVSDPAVEWFIYFQQGQITYASHNVDAFERLERYLRGLSREFSQLTPEVRAQIRSQFEGIEQQNNPLTSDYQAIVWLVDNQLLDPLMAGTLASKITAEVFEGYLLLPEGNYQVETVVVEDLPSFCSLDPTIFVRRNQERLKLWQALLPRINSPYQRPYLAGEAVARQKLAPDAVTSLSRLLIGFNFRQLGMFLKQDELMVAQRFSSLIADGVVILREPVAPFDKLPRLNACKLDDDGTTTQLSPPPVDGESNASSSNALGLAAASVEAKTWKVVCIDDSQAMLNEIQRLLEGDAFSLTLINDPKKALMKIVSIKPDLIMLDVTMPEMDGYQVCSMIRKSSAMTQVPIVMVTGNRGLIDRARAKMVGATDYLTKPFAQKDLLNLLLRHLET